MYAGSRMKAYASLHLCEPASQTDEEVAYEGYRRVPVDWHERFGEPAIKIEFPAIHQTTPGAATHLAVGTAEIGRGELLQVIALDPPRPLAKTEYAEVAGRKVPLLPNVIVGNFLQLPAGLHPIAAVAYALVNYREADPATWHPALYEAINDELSRCGVPVIPVTRSGAFEMDVKLSQLNLGSLLKGS
jgi:hypothetical protein